MSVGGARPCKSSLERRGGGEIVHGMFCSVTERLAVPAANQWRVVTFLPMRCVNAVDGPMHLCQQPVQEHH